MKKYSIKQMEKMKGFISYACEREISIRGYNFALYMYGFECPKTGVIYTYYSAILEGKKTARVFGSVLECYHDVIERYNDHLGITAKNGKRI